MIHRAVCCVDVILKSQIAPVRCILAASVLLVTSLRPSQPTHAKVQGAAIHEAKRRISLVTERVCIFHTTMDEELAPSVLKFRDVDEGSSNSNVSVEPSASKAQFVRIENPDLVDDLVRDNAPFDVELLEKR